MITKGDKIGLGALAVVAVGVGYEIYKNSATQTATTTTSTSSASSASPTATSFSAATQQLQATATATTVTTQEGAATVYTQPSSAASQSVTTALVVQPNGYVYGANPNGTTAVSTNYKAVVNANGGLYINHKWVPGSYGTGNTFIPAS